MRCRRDELIFNVTLQYKAMEAQGNVDWVSCYTEHADILAEFHEQDPDREEPN